MAVPRLRTVPGDAAMLAAARRAAHRRGSGRCDWRRGRRLPRRARPGYRAKFREAEVEGLGAAADAGELLQALVIALVEVTEVLAAKCGRAAKDAIFFQMVTGTVGHKTSK